MNYLLMEQIVFHVFTNLGLLKSSFVDFNVTKSLLDKHYLLPEKISFETEDHDLLDQPIYGCQINDNEGNQLKILVGDCSQDKTIKEYCIVISLKDAPTYGAYLVSAQNEAKPFDEALIAVSVDKKTWMPCNTYLQATFLAGMERLRDLGYGWSKCESYKDQHKMLISFLDFHSIFYGAHE